MLSGTSQACWHLARLFWAAQIVAGQRISHFGDEKGEGQATTELEAAIRELPQMNRKVFESLILVSFDHQPRVTKSLMSLPHVRYQ